MEGNGVIKEEQEYNLRWRKRKGENGGDIEEAEGTSGQEEDNERVRRSRCIP